MYEKKSEDLVKENRQHFYCINRFKDDFSSLTVLSMRSSDKLGTPFFFSLDPDQLTEEQDYDSNKFNILKVLKVLCYTNLNHFSIVAQIKDSNGQGLIKTGIFTFTTSKNIKFSFSRFVDYFELPFIPRHLDDIHYFETTQSEEVVISVRHQGNFYKRKLALDGPKLLI